MLVLEHLSKTFNPGTPNENQVFNDLSLKVEDGDFITVIGSNGAGKSTMLNAIAGVFPVDSGRIYLDGNDITNLAEYRRAAFIGRVFQDPMLGTSPSMTIEENLSLAFSRANNISLRWGLDFNKRKTFKKYLSDIPLGLEKRLTTKVRLLSGGQRQALTLIMATMKKPKLLLLDEHTAALDPKTAMLVNELTEEIIKKNSITTIMVTHNLEHAIKMGNRLIMMHKGRIVMDIKGEEKATMTIPRLLNKFEQLQGEKFVEDRVMLA
ncbi:MAG: putative tryptophan/tyrosine transport system ATP-binding protein [Thermoanaerobacteraceae bacterium]|jgi:putative ABC transport system ATP-binding protein|uniref:ATP-binding cassette domain-containing protein n=1 Tax=Biomaibacter acetigenes TaxID=2316383 RepID=A0A3G2R6B1_9FIRM|nr:ATP-binding cassette domain-containing protein [Biomaibacter acetigenes]AYO31104.1 ATP-binding cassette domain-containing protein [Biomaibacter acetigenes]MDK2880223.1 putative tryptophan/tyrosine transport system ATP-binding protein [Thermoanaerobacteraceae bacterium]MDN5313645.1 putative tryptophan/tyrosine transport system ATP-binding protein [Thermoanaerobacteraceae bacterium]